MKRIITALLIAALSIAAAPTWAQTPSIFDVDPENVKTSLDVGVASVFRDRYVGSDTSSTIVLPYVNATYKGRFFLNPALGAGVYAINKDKFRLAASTHLALGRDGKDTPFAGQSYESNFDVDATITSKISGRIYLPIAALDIVGTVPLTGGLRGARLDTVLTTSISPFENFTITPGVRATFNTSNWLNTNYGISASQALASGLNEVSVNGGLSTIGAHAALYYKLTNDYKIVGVVNHSWLMRGVKDSPLTPSNSGLTAAIGVSKSF